MDRFLAPHTPEAVAYFHVSQNSADIHSHHLDHFDENLVACSASYDAFERYLSGVDLFILPRTRSELENEDTPMIVSTTQYRAVGLHYSLEATAECVNATASSS
ncbi:hypothetical protein FB446DRAFT_783011 [Lentinula raphanica]|nr:hypothetical protein FB446DRAFT_783011 [Lentinula raphanica]